jgi:hypothetical protein
MPEAEIKSNTDQAERMRLLRYREQLPPERGRP